MLAQDLHKICTCTCVTFFFFFGDSLQYGASCTTGNDFELSAGVRTAYISLPGGLSSIKDFNCPDSKNVVKHAISVEELNCLFAGQVLILLVVLDIED